MAPLNGETDRQLVSSLWHHLAVKVVTKKSNTVGGWIAIGISKKPVGNKWISFLSSPVSKAIIKLRILLWNSFWSVFKVVYFVKWLYIYWNKNWGPERVNNFTEGHPDFKFKSGSFWNLSLSCGRCYIAWPGRAPHPRQVDPSLYPQLSHEIQVGGGIMQERGGQTSSGGGCRQPNYAVLFLLLSNSAVHRGSPCACLESGFALEWYGGL